MCLTARDRYANCLLLCGLSLVGRFNIDVNHLTVMMHLDYVAGSDIDVEAGKRAKSF